MLAGRAAGLMRALSMRQLRLAGVFPGGVPERADIGGGGLIVETVVILVGVGIEAAAGVAVREKNGLEPTVRAETGFEGVIGGIVDEQRVIGTHGEEGSVAIDQGGSKAFVDAGLIGEAAIGVVRGVERVVRRGDIVGENRGVQLGFFPFAV